MSSYFKFTPYKNHINNELYNQNYSPSSFQFANRINSNNFSQNNYFSNQKNNSPYSQDKIDEINNNYFSQCYLLITNFDNSKEYLLNFFEQKRIDSRDMQFINNKIIIKFQNISFRQQFINDFNKVGDIFSGIQIKIINEEEKDKIINNNTNRIIHNISYKNNYINNENNMIQLPQRKSTLQRFLDVFLNL